MKINNKHMINQILANSIAIIYENEIKGIFKKYGLKTKKLDVDKSTKSPDFLVYKDCNHRDSFICECKYIASAGYNQKTGKHISTLDLPGFFIRNNICDKLKEEIYVKINQYKELIRNKPIYKKIPFVIALKMDSIIENDFDLLDLSSMDIPELSAIIKIEKDIERKEYYASLSIDEMKDLVHKMLNKIKIKINLPQSSKRFKVKMNINSTNKFKADYFLRNPIFV